MSEMGVSCLMTPLITGRFAANRENNPHLAKWGRGDLVTLGCLCERFVGAGANLLLGAGAFLLLRRCCRRTSTRGLRRSFRDIGDCLSEAFGH